MNWLTGQIEPERFGPWEQPTTKLGTHADEESDPEVLAKPLPGENRSRRNHCVTDAEWPALFSRSFGQHLPWEGKARALVAACDRMTATIRLLCVEKEPVICIRDGRFPPDVPDEHTGAREHNLVPRGHLFTDGAAGWGPTAHVSDGEHRTSKVDLRLKMSHRSCACSGKLLRFGS
jgi:hypothetical protein